MDDRRDGPPPDPPRDPGRTGHGAAGAGRSSRVRAERAAPVAALPPPEDDGNGNALAADARDGCDGTAPLRWIRGPLTVAVTRGDRAGLVFSGAFVMNVRFGETLVSAGQDWTFTVSRTPAGWHVVDVGRVIANVNWAPALSD